MQLNNFLVNGELVDIILSYSKQIYVIVLDKWKISPPTHIISNDAAGYSL